MEVTTSLVNLIKCTTEDLDKKAKLITLNRTVQIKTRHNENNRDLHTDSREQIANEMIAEAKEEADKLLYETEKLIQKKKLQLQKEDEALQNKIKEALEEARLQGYQEGYDQGRLDGEKSISQSVLEAQRLVDAAKKDYLNKLKEAEPEIVKMAVKITEKVIGETLKQQPEQWTSIVKTVLKEVKEHENIRIIVHPTKYERTIQQKRELLSVLNDSTDLSIYPDQELHENGCLIETSFGTINASIDSQLSEIKRQLIEYIEEFENA